YCSGNCTRGAGDCSLSKSWFGRNMPRLKHGYVYEHRERIGRALSSCSHFVVPSAFMLPLLIEKFPVLRNTRVIEYGRDMSRMQLAVPPTRGVPVRIACLANFNESKGTLFLLQLMELNMRLGSRFEFHFLGDMAPNFKPQTRGGIYHGRYD